MTTTTTLSDLSELVDAIDELGRVTSDPLGDLVAGTLPGDLPAAAAAAADALSSLVVLPEPSVEGCPELFVRVDGQVVLVGYDDSGRVFVQPWSYVDSGPDGELWRDGAGEHRVFAV